MVEPVALVVAPVALAVRLVVDAGWHSVEHKVLLVVVQSVLLVEAMEQAVVAIPVRQLAQV
ncbi:hypothetical protein BRE01_47070 [Brevibacillus reuszeri]|uniref:Secreted protein n=1 Tax=Brevibacillus reuszeri TaxID=54915 RepID=A0A0K9Z0C9_9BACL|nr:hypothetical protein [Brevibacillus reuszeri]KNB73920.1 hypothetical protein ADS79_08310 [Brevibacillus reuszeri]MED1859929.1 hypothetical protein [Brevibacillus reuszeri]GED71005.1 hypothetical protein BRE01_47070 [Brevibacillus reuszeri]